MTPEIDLQFSESPVRTSGDKDQFNQVGVIGKKV